MRELMDRERESYLTAYRYELGVVNVFVLVRDPNPSSCSMRARSFYFPFSRKAS